MEGMLNTKREQVNKDLELQRVYDSYLKAQGELLDALDERMDKTSENEFLKYDLWEFIFDLKRQIQDNHKIYGMNKLINREQGVHNYGILQKIDYSPLED